VDALAERVEVLAALGVEEDDLAVEHVAPGGELQLGEVAAQRLAVARLEVDVLTVDEGDRPEAVPLGLVDPAVALGEGLGGAGELGEDRRGERKGHAADPTRRAPATCGGSSKGEDLVERLALVEARAVLRAELPPRHDDGGGSECDESDHATSIGACAPSL
jgi:hypothetical protein